MAFNSPKLVVLVEDYEPIRTLAAEVLWDAGFIVIELDCARDAMQLLGYLASTVHVLFTDNWMPGEMDGLGLICHAHRTWPWVSLLLTSGHLAPRSVDMPPKSRFLPKPYNSRQMVTQVTELAGA